MKTKTYQIKNINPALWKRVHRMCLEKDTNLRTFILNFLIKAVEEFEENK
jgi:hypothetical protein